MYAVNQHFIQPRTRAAGGVSYALMLHPKGMDCDIFVTHAWSEGVFEFTRKVLRAWPKGKKEPLVLLPGVATKS